MTDLRTALQQRYAVVWVEAGEDWSITGDQTFRTFGAALKLYRDVRKGVTHKGLRVLLKRVVGKNGKFFWSLTEFERFGDYPERLSDALVRAGINRWEFAL